MSNVMELIFLFLAAFAGGFSNTAIGGGWFIVFPGLIFRGMQPVVSNATTMLTLWAGHVFNSLPVGHQAMSYPRHFKFMIVSCALGGVFGASLVVLMPYTVFEHVGPFLLLGSFVLFSCYKQLLGFVISKTPIAKEFEYSHAMLIPLFFLGVYGGYFGAGLGMIVFIAYRFYGISDNSLLERIASALVSVNAVMALIVFIYSDLIYWPFIPALVAGSVLGGYLGVLSRRKVNPTALKGAMTGIGALVTLYFLNLVI